MTVTSGAIDRQPPLQIEVTLKLNEAASLNQISLLTQKVKMKALIVVPLIEYSIAWNSRNMWQTPAYPYPITNKHEAAGPL